MIYQSILSDNIEPEIDHWGDSRVLLDDIKSSICQVNTKICDKGWIDNIQLSQDIFRRYYIKHSQCSWISALGVQYDKSVFGLIYSINIDVDTLRLYPKDIIDWDYFPLWNGRVREVQVILDNQSTEKCTGDFQKKFPANPKLTLWDA